jgi:hypothetical protein
MPTTLERILEEKRKEASERSETTESRKADWIRRTEELFQQIEKWLSPLKGNNYLDWSFDLTRRQEEPIGVYQVRSMRIVFFNGRTLEIIPRGLIVVGANGRVDMDLGYKSVMIAGKQDGSGWEFVERIAGRAESYEFNQANFERILSDFASRF